MTTIDRIRAEIERRKELLTPHKGQGLILCREIIKQFDSLLSFIDTISQPIMKHDIIDEIRAEIERLMSGYKPIVGGVDELTGANIVLAKLLSFLDTLEEPVSDCHDLKKHTKEWVELMVGASFPEQEGDFISEEDYRSVIKKTALHFAEWQKAKMMEGAVEGYVGVHLRDKRADVTVNSGYLPKGMGIKGDSKVKIIIVKEEEQ